MDPEQANRLRSDFSAAQEAVKTGVSAGRASSAIAVWNIWSAFTSELGLDPFLQAFPDKIPFLQIFAVRVRCGELSASGCAVRARSAEDYVRHVAQAFLNVGAEDPRLNSAHQIDFRLQRMIKSWKSSDPAPLRVKPIPIQVIRRVATLSQLSSANDSLYQATTDMIILAFFFLLRPGEYTDNDNTPFCLKDVQLFIGPRCLNLQTSSAAELAQARFGSLTFTDQKNGVRGEVIGQASTGDSFVCPVKSLVRRILYLRSHNAPPTTPLSRVFNTPARVTPSVLTATLRDCVQYLGPDLGFLPSEVSARSLRAAGATALLLARVDTDVIRLIGRWRSDEMLRYLHVQAYPLMRNYSRLMLDAGDYTLIPNQLVPQR